MHTLARTCLHATGLLAVVVAVLTSSVAPAAAAGGFGDVDDDAYYAEAVTWMADRGITTGIEPGCFGPGDSVTRGQVAAFLFRLDRELGNDPQTAPHPFVDVVFAHEQESVGWLHGRGITQGVTETEFAPARAVTRGDFATLLWRYAGRPEAPDHRFVDIDFSYQDEAVAWMAAEGITDGRTPTMFDPHRTVTRSEAAAFLHRYVDPAAAPDVPDGGECPRDLRAALVAGGLTAAEAACAAPWLTDFTVEYLTAVVNDVEPASFELILAVAIINDEGCVSDDRIAELTRLYL